MELIPTIIGNQLSSNFLDNIGTLLYIVKEADDVQCTTQHHFSPGLYVREFHMPKDSVVVGAKHKQEHMLMLASGKISIWTEEGEEIIQAPDLRKSWVGCQRILYAYEDSVLLSFHPTTTTDLDELRKELIEEDV